MVVEIKTVDCVTHIKRTKVPFKSLLFILQKKENQGIQPEGLTPLNPSFLFYKRKREGIKYFSFILFYKREERERIEYFFFYFILQKEKFIKVKKKKKGKD